MADPTIWNASNIEEKGRYRHFPSEFMLRAVFSQNYFFGEAPRKGTVLDVGCLYGNNLIPFRDRNFECYGTEVTSESVNIARACLKSAGIECDVFIGHNTALPFKDHFFDVLLSLSTIHYEESYSSIKRSIEEFARVLKDDGTLYVSTAGPLATIVTKSVLCSDKGGARMLLDSNDIRDRQVFMFIESEENFRSLLSPFFSDVQIARDTQKFPAQTVDVFLARCRK